MHAIRAMHVTISINIRRQFIQSLGVQYFGNQSYESVC